MKFSVDQSFAFQLSILYPVMLYKSTVGLQNTFQSLSPVFIVSIQHAYQEREVHFLIFEEKLLQFCAWKTSTNTFKQAHYKENKIIQF